MAEMKDEMSEGAVRYAFMKYTVGNVNKFVYISWCPDGVTGMLKGRFNQHVKVRIHVVCGLCSFFFFRAAIR